MVAGIREHIPHGIGECAGHGAGLVAKHVLRGLAWVDGGKRVAEGEPKDGLMRLLRMLRGGVGRWRVPTKLSWGTLVPLAIEVVSATRIPAKVIPFEFLSLILLSKRRERKEGQRRGKPRGWGTVPFPGVSAASFITSVAPAVRVSFPVVRPPISLGPVTVVFTVVVFTAVPRPPIITFTVVPAPSWREKQTRRGCVGERRGGRRKGKGKERNLESYSSTSRSRLKRSLPRARRSVPRRRKNK